MSNLRSRRHYIGGDGEYITEMRKESDIGCRQNERECQEMRESALEHENFKSLKHDKTVIIGEEDKRIEGRKLDVTRAMKPKKPNDVPHCKPPSRLLEESKPTQQLILNEAHLAKLDLQATKSRILDSIDHMLSTADDAKVCN